MSELQAATKLIRLREREGKGKQEERIEQLRGVYDSFTEGFDTPDLVDARAVLDDAFS
jgi:hypothetical protein